MTIVLSVLAIFAVLCGMEWWWRRRGVHDEVARKFVHITVGSFVAFWPYYMTWDQIKLLSLAFLITVIVSKYLNIFKAIHSVQRPTWGEIFFAAVVGILAIAAPDKAIYTTALLQMSLADGLAAVVGTRFGNGQAYSLFGHSKSVVGTLTFFVVSLAILLVYAHFSQASFNPLLLPGLALLATFIENIAVMGIDNLLVPLLIGLILKSMH